MWATFTLLSTSEFADDLLRRIGAARSRVAIQLMTFDGDDAGMPVAAALRQAAARGVDTRLLIDCFALRYVSDERVTRPSVREEFGRTRAMYTGLAAGGVRVTFTCPNGPFGIYALARNHKKLFAIDDVVFLGGINVSDHNYGWHDFMVRTDDPSIVEAAYADFDVSEAGRRQLLDGPILTDGAIEATFDELVLGARDRIVVASPYAIDRHLARLMERSTARSKTVVVAAENNFAFLELITPYVLDRLSAAGVDICTYPRFSHAKFVLADERLLIGSSNYGRHSFWCNQEIGLVIDDRTVVEKLASELLDDLRPLTVPGRPGPAGGGADGVGHHGRGAPALCPDGRAPRAAPGRGRAVTDRSDARPGPSSTPSNRSSQAASRWPVLVGLAVAVGVACVGTWIVGLALDDPLLQFAGLMIGATTFVPLPADTFVLNASAHLAPATIGLVGGAINAAMALVERRWVQAFVDHRAFDRFVTFVGDNRLVGMLRRQMFVGLLIGGATFVPFEPFRLVAILTDYSPVRYAAATFLSRGGRYYLLALAGSALLEIGFLQQAIWITLALFAVGLWRSALRLVRSGRAGDVSVTGGGSLPDAGVDQDGSDSGGR